MSRPYELLPPLQKNGLIMKSMSGRRRDSLLSPLHLRINVMSVTSVCSLFLLVHHLLISAGYVAAEVYSAVPHHWAIQ